MPAINKIKKPPPLLTALSVLLFLLFQLPFALQAQEQGRFESFFKVFDVKEPIHLVLVEKSSQRLLVLKHDGRLAVVAEYPSVTGENPGSKEKNGDQRTPEGVYFITKIFDDNKITVFGKRALHLDYPNIFDKIANRDGNGIYIHGTNKKLEPESTNGCITLSNNDLDLLTNYMDKVVTPVVIVQDINSLQQPRTRQIAINRNELIKALLPESINPDQVSFDYLYLIDIGQQAVAVGEFDHILSDTARTHGYSRGYLELENNEWVVRERAWNIQPIDISPERPLKIISQRTEPGLLQVAQLSMPEPEKIAATKIPMESVVNEQKTTAPTTPLITAAASSQVSVPIKTKPVEKPPEASTPEKIDLVQLETPAVVPQNKEQPEKPATKQNTAGQSTELQHPAASEPLPRIEPEPEEESTVPAEPTSQPYPRDEKLIHDFLESWRQAWESKKIGAYIANYDETFRQGNMNLAAWKKYKNDLNRNYKFIEIAMNDIQITWTRSGASVSFAQVYRSDRYSAQGRKTLLLRYSDNKWAIVRELWSKKKGT